MAEIKSIQSNFKFCLIEGLGIAHSGDPTPVYKAVHELLKLMKVRKYAVDNEDILKAEELYDMFLHNPYGMYMIHQLNKNCPYYNGKKYDTYLDWGTSINSCWITDIGLQALEVLDDAWVEEEGSYDFILGDIWKDDNLLEKYSEEYKEGVEE